jgi:hypothetical protein
MVCSSSDLNIHAKWQGVLETTLTGETTESPKQFPVVIVFITLIFPP